MGMIEVSNQYQWWEIILLSATAIGTVGATALALWVSVIRDWSRRPRVELHFDPESTGDFYVAALDRLRGRYVGKLRLRVANESKHRTAEKVEVYVWRATDTESENELFGGVPLQVSNLSDGESRFDLPPGTSRHIDLIGISLGQDKYEIKIAKQEGRPLPPPVSARLVQFELMVSAHNMDAVRKTITVRRKDDANFPGTADTGPECPLELGGIQP
jgi:hypothetical protein